MRNMLQNANRFDVHAHFVPEFYRAAAIAAGHGSPDGMKALPEWDEDEALAVMDRLKIRTAMLSISSPGIHFGNAAAASGLARRVNIEGARLAGSHPGRFGHFAAVPLPDIDNAIAEAVYALDTLGADGITILTNQRGVYPGDPALEPFYAALNARKALIFIHPTSPGCACCPRLDAAYPRPMLEFMFETTRAVTDLLATGVLERHPDLRVLVPHAGAALPSLLERIELVLAAGAKTAPAALRSGLASLHFDLAGAPVPHLLRALLDTVNPDHLHYGSDWPFTPEGACGYLAGQLDATPLLDDAQRDRIYRRNALALFPRFAVAADGTAAA